MKTLNRRIIACLLIFGLVYISYDGLSRIKSANLQITESVPDVTVFVHGYKGTAVSFRSMLERFEQTYEWGRKALTCRVTADGRVLVDETAGFQTGGRLFVQVVFENNRASFHDSAYWLSKVLNVLHETYQVETVNIVGHSMGGIVSVKFLEDYSKEPGYPFVNKLVVLGSPFSGLKNKGDLKVNPNPATADLMPRSAALQKLFKQKHTFPSDVQVLALAGSGDQLVSVKSALSLDKIVPASQLQQAVVSDRRITHSGLHESEEVDRIIGRFLWNE